MEEREVRYYSFPKSHTALYVINNNSIESDVEFDVESGAKKGEISKAFKKNAEKQVHEQETAKFFY